MLGTLVVVIVYVLANLAFVRMLGLRGVAESGAVAAKALQPTLGSLGARAISLLICLSCLGAINGMLFTGPRIYYAAGREHRLYRWLGHWSNQFDSPVRAMLIQGGVALAYVAGFGWYKDGFTKLLIFTTPVFWFFILMVGISIFLLRMRDGKQTPGYRVALFPLTPIVFCLFAGFLVYSSLTYAIQNHSIEAVWAGGILLLGLAMSYFNSPLES